MAAIRFRALALGALSLGVAMFVGPPAAAAPQVLGLMASNEPIPFTCTEEECYALAGSFCLQRDRDVPTYGHPYEANFPDRLTLSAIDGTGAVRSLSGAAANLRFHAYSGYSMARISLPRAELERLGAAALALQVGPGVSLIPLARPGDADPQTPEEIALATGPLRVAAGRYLDRPGAGADAARLVAALANGLPERRTIHDDTGNLWNDVVGERWREEADPEALRRAERSYRLCAEFYSGSLRQCLISHHQQMMVPDNREYWESLGGY
jgi:hypothetical protein